MDPPASVLRHSVCPVASHWSQSLPCCWQLDVRVPEAKAPLLEGTEEQNPLTRHHTNTHTQRMDPDKSTDKLCLHTAGHFILFPLNFPMFSSLTPPWSFPFPPLFSFPNRPIISPFNPKMFFFLCTPYWVAGWWPLSIPKVLQRAPWWSDALLEQPWRGPRQGHVSSLKLFGSPFMLLCSVLLCVCGDGPIISQPGKYLLSVRFFCCLGRSFSVSELCEFCHTHYTRSIGVSYPFLFIFLKNVRLRLKQ